MELSHYINVRYDKEYRQQRLRPSVPRISCQKRPVSRMERAKSAVPTPAIERGNKHYYLITIRYSLVLYSIVSVLSMSKLQVTHCVEYEHK